MIERRRLRRIGAASLTTLLLGVLTACDSPPQPVALPTPSTVYACPTGQLQVEGAATSESMINSYISSYAEACRNRATVVWTSAEDSGHESLVNGLVQIATSETWLTSDEDTAAQRRCQQNPAWHLPTTATPVSVIYRLDGVAELTLSPNTLAMIFSGQVKRWNDPSIAAENPEARLPSQPIQVWYPNRPSGAAEAFGRYLARKAPLKWSSRNTTPNWRGQGQGKDRPQDVAVAVQAKSGTIGFLGAAERDEANIGQSKIGEIAVKDGDRPLRPTLAASRLALGSARFLEPSGNDLRIDPTSLEAEGAYPIQAITYQVVCSQGLPVEVTSLERDFLGFMINPQTQSGLPQIGRVPLPDGLRTRVQEAVAAIR